MPMAVDMARRRFTADEYHQMGLAQVLKEDDRVELIDGEVVEMTPIGAQHAGVVNRLNRLLTTRAGQVAMIAVQNPVRIDIDSVLQPRSDDYTFSHPVPDDVLLLIEVADTSAGLDLGLKVPKYAQAGIRKVWVVDLRKKVVVTHLKPDGPRYLQVETVEGRGKLQPEFLVGVELGLDEVLG